MRHLYDIGKRLKEYIPLAEEISSPPIHLFSIS